MSNEISVHIEPAKKEDAYTLSVSNGQTRQYALSKYVPVEDAIRRITLDGVTQDTIWVLWGYCLGYAMDKIIEECGKEVSILILEPDGHVLKEQLHHREKQYLDLPNILWVTEKNILDIKNYVRSRPQGTEIRHIENDIYKVYYSSFFNEVLLHIKDTLYKKDININTFKHFAYQFFDNALRNGDALMNSYDITLYKDIYKDVPAVIVSAGPSLEKNICHLRDFKGVVFTGGRTLSNVLEQGKKPDFIVSLDAGLPAYQVLKDCKVYDVPLIASIHTHYKVVEGAKGPVFFVDLPEYNFAEQVYECNIPKVKIGGSVATLCLERAYHMGCNPIIFIGQDLAYTDGKKHAGEGKVVLVENSRKVPGYYGKVVETGEDWYMFLNWFERFIESFPDRTYINSTEGGVAIDGTLQKTFEEIVQVYNQTYDKPTPYTLVKKPKDLTVPKAYQNIMQDLKRLEKIIIKGKQLTSALRMECSNPKGLNVVKVKQIVHQLDNHVDKHLKKVGKYTNVIFIPIYAQIESISSFKAPLKETLVEEIIRIAKTNDAWYDAVEQAVVEMQKRVKQEIDEIEER